MNNLVYKSTAWFVVIAIYSTSALADGKEIYILRHRVVETEEGSPVWNSYSEADKARYLKETEDEGFSGKPAEVSDYFVGNLQDDKHYAFCVQHVGHLMHMCELSGVATKNGNAYYYQDTAEPECKLKIAFASGKVTFEDIGSNCAPAYCGARALFENAEFAASDRVSSPEKIKEALDACKLPGKL